MPANTNDIIDDIIAILDSLNREPLVHLDAEALRMIYDKAGLPDCDIPKKFKAVKEPLGQRLVGELFHQLPDFIGFMASMNAITYGRSDKR